MNYQQTLEYLYSQLPMYQRIGKAAYKANLNNTILICKLLGNPQNKFKSIHIAGTNGKGSTAHILSSILQESNYKVGLYTSPHLKDFRERIKINGIPISEKEVVHFVRQYKTSFEQIKPSFFEMTVGLAFYYFYKQKIDIAIIETGLGGRLDSTNVITPLLSIITNIGYDHTQFLGDTLEQIAAEKAGIIKQNIPVVIGETQKKIQAIFIQKAKENSAVIYFADKEIKENNFQTDLLGAYQSKNIKTVIQSIRVLKEKGFNIPYKKIQKGLKSVVKNTGLLGRWQIISKTPLTIFDIAHNKEGLKEIVKQIEQTPHKKLHFVLGFVDDKNLKPIFELLPNDATYYFCKANIPRGLDTEELKKQANKAGLNGNTYPSIEDALKEAQLEANKEDLVFVGGSAFVVAEVVRTSNCFQ